MAKNLRKLMSLMLKRNKDSISIERKSLMEIFDSSLVSIYRTFDDLPALVDKFENYLAQKGFKVDYTKDLVYIYDEWDDALQYENTTGKYYSRNGVVAEGFKKWKRGEKVYNRDKERISLYVSDETKNIWQDFIKESNYSTISKLIRESVKAFISQRSSMGKDIQNISLEQIIDLLNSLKEILTSIKGYSHLFLEKYRSELSDEMLSLSKNIFKHSLLIKNKIDRFSEDLQILTPNYDILIMHHDISILRVVKKYYEEKGYSCKAVPSCAIGLEDLKKTVPKVILLGIVMPALSGYDVCKTIKSDKRYENVLLFYMSAMPPSEIEKNLRETKADGYVSLPFDYSDLDNVIEILKTKESNN